jgi:cytosine/adenosine deaminase-related metal-dependent hydrolase
MHLLETRAQREMGFRLYGTGTLAHLQRLGVLSPRANLVHALWLEDGDLDLIAAADAAIVHNPVSNARLGSGIFALTRALEHGIRVAVGTDSACCNDSNNLLETVKWATLLHNLGNPDPETWVSPARALRLATSGGADALGLGAVSGRIAPGMAADLVLLRLDAPAFVPLLDPVRQLVQSENGASVDTVLVGGQIVLQHGRCTTMNETEIWAEARDLAARRLRDNREIYAAAAALDPPVRRMIARLSRPCCP